MAAETFTFNIAKGRITEFYFRVKNNDPANSALIVIPMGTAGTATQGQDLDTFALVEADANFSEQTGGGWVRKTLTDADLVAFPAPDDTNDQYPVALPSMVWTTPTTGSNVQALVVCYDSDTTAAGDSGLVPLTCHIFAVTANNNSVTSAAGNFWVPS